MYSGLSSKQAQTHLEEYGQNVLASSRSFSLLHLIFSQFSSPLIYVLLIAAFITLVLREYVDMSVILLAVLVNAALGFVQEYKAQNALESLAKVLPRRVTVVRDGGIRNISIEEVVPGDVVHLEAGEQIPADGVWLHAKEVSVNEAVLTGESLPVEKKVLANAETMSVIPSSQDANAVHFGYMGTTLSSGKAVMKVISTGTHTVLGGISTSLQTTTEIETPLQNKLQSFSKKLTVLVVLASCLIFFLGILYGRELKEMFTLSVAVAVSSIPEGLVISLTAILAIGMQRILKKKALVRKLVAAETLGSVSVICTDKTGTLTKGELTVFHIESDRKALMHEIARSVISGSDPLEIAIRLWADEHAMHLKVPPIIDEVPFSADRKFSVRMSDELMIVLGAPEALFKICKKIDRPVIEQAIKIFTTQGYRVVGAATRKVKKGEGQIVLNSIDGMEWAGCFVFRDEVRTGLTEVFELAKEAGISIKVITGDYAETARSVMRELKLSVKPSEVMLGSDLKAMSQLQLKERIPQTKLFARTSPDQKLIIVQVLQELGEVVAMTGDGVNDAPALKRADIGIVVSSASDVSKDTADMVLLDDDFRTIIEAVEEGRGIFENLRKVILYLLSDSFTEIILVMGAVVLGLPLPVTAAQILWVNLIDDGLPNLALTVDPNGKELFYEQPRKRSTPLIDGEMTVLIAAISIVTGAFVLGAYYWVYMTTGSLTEARTIAFTMLGVDSLFYVFSSRSLRKSIWEEGIFKNIWLVVAVVIGFLFQLVALYVPFFQRWFETRPLTLEEWVIVFSSSAIILLVVEVIKWIWSWKQRLH
ncbi:MAG: HAD-IC family P-type ATPase [Patescibacteria group bacterium]